MERTKEDPNKTRMGVFKNKGKDQDVSINIYFPRGMRMDWCAIQRKIK